MIIYYIALLTFIPLLSFLSRAAGGGAGAGWLVYTVGTRYGAFWGSAASRLPEMVWAIIIGGVASSIHDLPWYIAPFLQFYEYWCMELGHGTFYAMKGFDSPNDPLRIQSIEKIVRPIYLRAGGDIRQPIYSWFCMGFKGFIVGLPLYPWGLLLTVLWPLAYWISFRVMRKDSGPAEIISGAFAGAIIVIALIT